MKKNDNAQWLQGRSINDIDLNIGDWGLIESFQEDITISAHLESKYISEARKRYAQKNELCIS